VIAEQVATERALLVETLREVGPDADTLAADWSARDVARHLAAQDRFSGVPAFLARRLVTATGVRLTETYLRRPRIGAVANGLPRTWDHCLRRLDCPPPAAVVRQSVVVITMWEHVVHHEDVRRPANIARRAWPDLSAVISWLLAYNRSRLQGIALRMVASNAGEWRVGEGSSLTVCGEPGELVLWLSGRAAASNVVLTGSTADVDSLTLRLAI